MKVLFYPRCPTCKGIVITDEERGELICGDCGIVIRDRIVETGPEWRAFTEEEKRSRIRTGPLASFSNWGDGLSTFIGKRSMDASGKTLAADTKRLLQRMRTWDNRSKFSNKQRNILVAMNFLSRLADKLQLSNTIQEEAAYIYRKILSNKLVKGRSINGMVTTCVYAACRNSMVPRTLTDIAKASNIRRKEIARNYRTLLRRSDMKMPTMDPSIHISRIANKVGLNEKIQRAALEIIDKARQKGIVVGKNPMGLAAAALYVASVIEDEAITQEKLADAAGITSVTVRNRYSELKRITKSGKQRMI